MSELEAPPMYGARFESALVFASQQHFGQRRKSSGEPYISHPLAVASIVAQYGGDEEQAIAALLHDVVEDCGVKEATLRARYGDRVARIVMACTDATEKPKPPWRPRKEAHIAKVHGIAPDARLVMAADKYHNALSIQRDLRRQGVGEQVWERFSAAKPDVLWYYRAMSAALSDGWENDLGSELARVVHELG